MVGRRNKRRERHHELRREIETRQARQPNRRQKKAATRFGHSLEPKAVPCPCGATTEPKTGEHVYPRRRDLAKKRFYVCPSCERRCGCHPDTWEPLGTPANAAERKARQAAHAYLDPLWKANPKIENKGFARAKVYEWLTRQLGIQPEQCHIGMMDVETCNRVVELCRPLLERRGLSPDWS